MYMKTYLPFHPLVISLSMTLAIYMWFIQIPRMLALSLINRNNIWYLSPSRIVFDFLFVCCLACFLVKSRWERFTVAVILWGVIDDVINIWTQRDERSKCWRKLDMNLVQWGTMKTYSYSIMSVTVIHDAYPPCVTQADFTTSFLTPFHVYVRIILQANFVYPYPRNKNAVPRFCSCH